MGKIIVALTLVLVIQTCGDPGYRLRPVGWKRIADNEWRKEFSDFTMSSHGIRGLAGESSIDPDLEIINNSKPISVESAALVTATDKYSASIYGGPIPPSARGYHLQIVWRI